MESVLLVTERSTWGTLAAEQFCSPSIELTHVEYSFGEDRASALEIAEHWTGQYVIAFKADLRLTEATLSGVRAAVNFHPAPPWYRGVAGPERAIKSADRVYGTTCHHMTTALDAGEIIDVRTFAIARGTTSQSLHARAAAELLAQLADQWTRRAEWGHCDAGSTADPKWSGSVFSCRDTDAQRLFA